MPRRTAIAVLFLSLSGAAPQPAGAPADDLDARVGRLEEARETTDRDAAVRRGAKTFRNVCAACHGSGGKGDGPGAAGLDPRPRDLSTRRFRFRSTPSGDPPLPDDLERTIRRGLPGSAMPAYGDLLSSDEIAGLIAFIYSLQPDAASGPELPPAVPLPEIPPARPDTIEEGRSVYLLMGCWRCHDLDGSGRGPSARGLVDEADRPIHTTDFRYDPFKGGRGRRDVARDLLTGLNGAPMPSYAEALLFAGDDFPHPGAVAPGLDAEGLQRLERYLATLPGRARLAELTDEERLALRDRRLAALTDYVLSLDERRGFWFRLLRQQPEREARRER
jgi:mono/diheme cytochrome c family protein